MATIKLSDKFISEARPHADAFSRKDKVKIFKI